DVLSTGLWDGVFYDEVQDSISWVGPTDVNRDHVTDTIAEADALWAQNYTSLFQKTRALIGNDAIMITNGSSNRAFSPYVNGRMYETFPSSNDTLAEWKNMTRDYLKEESSVGFPPINIVNVNTKDTGTQNDFKSVRFGLTTTLLGNGYFSFDFGTTDHAQVWTYDEYNASLGLAKSTITHDLVTEKILERQFERGRVLVNATKDEQTISLNGDFEKLRGTQDPTINDGSIVSEVTLASRDGIILLRPIDEIIDTTFRNGAFARIFSGNGTTKRNGFFAYDSAFRGGVQIVHVDYDRDGKRDTIMADKTFVRVFDAYGNLHASFAPYTEAYDKGVNIAVGDIENDGSFEIVTGTLNGASSQIRIFNTKGTLINPGFFAFDKSFRGGANVALGDLNGDGTKEIIVGAAALGGPHIRMFNKVGKLINPGFFAFDKKFRGGVTLASGDIDGDGVDEIVAGMGAGGSPEVRVFDRNGKVKSHFFAGDKKQKNGVKIAATDIDGDGKAEIISLSTDVFTLSSVR
ncbi:MAG: putative glycoside hydrolase, partial [Patescibacteria group bacterium]